MAVESPQMEQVFAQMQVLNDQNRALQIRLEQNQARLEQAEQEVIRQKAVNEQSAQVVAALSQLPQTLQAMIKPSDGKRVLVDAKGLGKPSPFTNSEQEFLKWSRKTANFMNSVLKGLNPVLINAVDEDDVLDWKKFKESQIDMEDGELDDMNEQVYHCLVALTDNESFDLVMSAGEGQGFEAWRKLNRR